MKEFLCGQIPPAPFVLATLTPLMLHGFFLRTDRP